MRAMRAVNTCSRAATASCLPDSVCIDVVSAVTLYDLSLAEVAVVNEDPKDIAQLRKSAVCSLATDSSYFLNGSLNLGSVESVVSVSVFMKATKAALSAADKLSLNGTPLGANLLLSKAGPNLIPLL